MSAFIRTTCVALAALALVGGVSLAAETEADQWKWRAPIQPDQTPGEGLVELPIPPAVFDRARPDLADLRVRSADGREAAYVLRRPRGSSRRIPLEAKLLNRTYRPGEQTSITADFGEKLLKNQIEVVTGGRNFRRRVRVRGSNDAKSWETVREGAFLFHIAGGPATGGYRKDIIALPDNNQRYLRITIYHGPDDPEQLAIEEVRAYRTVEHPPETTPVEVADREVVNRPDREHTEINLDLGHRNLPLYRLRLRFREPNFFRPVEVLGRNRIERVVEIPVEGGAPRREVREEPWHHITGGAVYRYPGGGSAESLSLNLEGARTRYLQVRVRNYDDPPLTFQGARVNRLRSYLAYRPGGRGPYMLYFGNESASRPRYDLERYADRLRGEGVLTAALGEVERNPAFGVEEKEAPWAERHRGLIWAGLLLVLAVLGVLIYRQAKGAPQEAS